MKHYVEPNDMALDSTPGILSTRLDEFHSVSWFSCRHRDRLHRAGCLEWGDRPHVELGASRYRPAVDKADNAGKLRLPK